MDNGGRNPDGFHLFKWIWNICRMAFIEIESGQIPKGFAPPFSILNSQFQRQPLFLFPVPCPPVPCSLFPVPCSLFPAPCSLFPWFSYSLLPIPYSLLPTPYSLLPIPCSLISRKKNVREAQTCAIMECGYQFISVMIFVLYRAAPPPGGYEA